MPRLRNTGCARPPALAHMNGFFECAPQHILPATIKHTPPNIAFSSTSLRAASARRMRASIHDRLPHGLVTGNSHSETHLRKRNGHVRRRRKCISETNRHVTFSGPQLTSHRVLVRVCARGRRRRPRARRAGGGRRTAHAHARAERAVCVCVCPRACCVSGALCGRWGADLAGGARLRLCVCARAPGRRDWRAARVWPWIAMRVCVPVGGRCAGPLARGA